MIDLYWAAAAIVFPLDRGACYSGNSKTIRASITRPLASRRT